MQIDALKRTLALLRGVEETSVTTFELSFIAGLMACGKHATLPVFFGARQAQVRKWGNYVRFDDWVEKNSVVGYAKWRENICELFQELALSKIEAERIVDESVATYLQWVKAKHLSQQQLSERRTPSNTTILARVMAKLPAKLKVVLRPLYWFVRSRWHLYQMFGANLTAIYVFRRDWGNIKSTILRHPLADNNH